MIAALSPSKRQSSFEKVVLPSRGRFVAETDTEIKNPLQATVKIFDTPEFIKAIETSVPEGLGLIKANEAKKRPAQDKTAELRDAIVKTISEHYKTHFQSTEAIKNLSEVLDQTGSLATNIKKLLTISESNTFAGTGQEYTKVVIGALSESLALLIPANKTELDARRDNFDKSFIRAIDRWGYKSGQKKDPNKHGKDVDHDFSEVRTALSDALQKIFPADFLKTDTQITEIRVGQLKLLLSDNSVVINDKISNIKTTIQLAESETDTNKRDFFTELLKELKSDFSIASSQKKFADAVQQLVLASAGNVTYENLETPSVPTTTEEILPSPNDTLPVIEKEDNLKPSATKPHSETAEIEMEEELELLWPDFNDPYAPTQPTELGKTDENAAEKIVDAHSVPEALSKTTTPNTAAPEKATTPTPSEPTPPSLLEKLREEMAVFQKSLVKGDDKQVAQLPILLDSLSAKIDHGIYQSNGIISNLNIYTELGQLYAEITAKDSKGNDTLLSFRLKQGASGDELLEALSELGKNLDKDTGTSIANSKTVLDFLAIGQIQSIQPKNGGKVVLEKVNWLGSFLAAEAQISNVIFKNSNVDLSGKRSVISGCTFEGCRISMNLVDARIENSAFDKKSVITGRFAGTFSKGELHSNALTLDLKETTFELQNVRKALRGVLLDRNLIPVDIKVYCTPITDKRLQFEQKQLEERFNQDTIRAIIHEYSQANLTTKIGGYSAILMSSNWRVTKNTAGDTIDQKVMQSVLVPAAAGINDEYIDLYPPESDLLDKKKADETIRLRILMAKNGQMFAKYGTAQELESFTLYDKLKSPEGIIYGSNLKIFQEVLNFYHVSRSEKPSFSSDAVEVKEAD